jgi:Phage integrase, N-terminal SAM-like domain
MTPLRQRMIEDMQVRNLSANTQASYLQQVSLFACHFGKSPHLLSQEDIRVFTVEVLTLRGLVTYYALFFIRLESRKVDIAGLTVHPNEQWMQQIARNVTMDGCGALRDCRYLLHDRDAKYSAAFRATIETARDTSPTGAKPQSECLRRAMGTVGPG